MTKFLKLIISNFYSWKGSTVFNLNKQGLVLVEGNNLDEPSADSNMVGKSAIADALSWCLYAKTIRNVKHDEVVNRFVKKNCRVSVFFRKSTGRYKVSRYRRHKKYGNRLLVYRNKKLLDYRHESDIQTKLEEILEMDFQAFAHTIIFGGPKPFSLLTDAEQKKVLESFLNFGKFDLALNRTKQLLNEAEIGKQNVDNSLALLSNNCSSIRKNIKFLIRAQDLKGSSDIQVKLDNLEPPRKFRIEKKSIKLKRILESISSKLSKFEDRISIIESELLRLKTQIRHKGNLIGKPCPTCKRKINENTLADFLDILKNQKKQKNKKLQNYNYFRSKLRKRFEKLNQDYRILERKKERHQEYIISYREKKQSLLGQLKKSKSISNQLETELYNLIIRYTKLVNNVYKLQNESKKQIKYLQRLQFWVDGFGNKGIKALIVRKAIPVMNRKLQEYSSKVQKGTVEIKFEPTKKTKKGIEKELFNLSYKSKFGSASYLGESAGGRIRTDLVIILTFCWLTNSSNLLIVDEFLDKLDETGKEIALEILSELRSTVLVISHNSNLKSRFNKIWTITKSKGSSKLEEVWKN